MELNLFWIVFLSITIIIAGISFISVNVKKLIEKLKELKIQQNVTVMPISNMENNENSSRSELAQMMECFGVRLNNAKYNDPMLTGKQMASLIIFSFSMILAIIIFRDFVPIVDPHKAFVYQVIIIEPILLKILIPIAYLIIKQDFRRYFCKNIKIIYYNNIIYNCNFTQKTLTDISNLTEHIDEYRPEDNGYPDDLLEDSDNEGPNYVNIFCKNTDHSDLQVGFPEYLKDNEHPEKPEDVKEVSDDEGSDFSNTFLEATTHFNLQEDFPTENSRNFKCSYGCDFSTFSIEEYMEHFQLEHLHKNMDPKAMCPSYCCPGTSKSTTGT